jgi:polyisoprenoid-binding protein YceI
MNFLAISLLPILMALTFTTTTIDTEIKGEIQSSSIIWKAYKVTGEHAGTVDLKSGALEFDAEGELTGGSFVMDMNTIAVTDITGEMAGKLRGHLMGDDFFGVANNPTATLTITKVAAKGTPREYKVTADLTIKGKTAPVKFYTTITEIDGMKKATADIKVDRSEFDVKYGSSSFFSRLGDKTIYDEFDISVELLVK